MSMRGAEGKSSLTFTILGGPKKNKNRHPAGGYYWAPDHPKGTPKKYTPPKPQSPLPMKRHRTV